MKSIDEFAAGKLRALADRGLKRRLEPTAPAENRAVRRQNGDGGEVDLIDFCSNDYLAMTRHADVIEAAKHGTGVYGAGAGASRYISGDLPPNRSLESRLARLKGTEAACLFGSGYLANIGVIPCFVGAGDLVLADELCHASLLAGVRLSGAAEVRFSHNDLDELRTALAARRGDHRRCLIVTEGVFGMDGDLAPLPDMQALAEEWEAWTYVDDAHGFGVVGGGLGSAFAHGKPVKPDLQMGTLSKALGGYGGYICGSGAVIDYIRNRARSAIYSTGLPGGVLAGVLAAAEILDADRDMGARVIAKARRFAQGLNLPEPAAAIVPLVIGEPEPALEASAALAERGFLVTAIRPPTVPDGTARLRFTFSLAHEEAEIDKLVETVRDLGLAA